MTSWMSRILLLHIACVLNEGTAADVYSPTAGAPVSASNRDTYTRLGQRGRTILGTSIMKTTSRCDGQAALLVVIRPTAASITLAAKHEWLPKFFGKQIRLEEQAK